MAVSILLLAIGFALLVMGGEGVVRGASSLARKLSISPLIIGLTVVAFGTSSPELGVSIFAGLQGKDDIAIANVVGSNIFNILMAIGVPAAISSIRTSMSLLLRELPILLGVTLVATALAALGYEVDRPEAVVLCVGLLAFIGYSYWAARQESDQIVEEYDGGVGKETQTWLSFAFVAIGVVLLVGGSRLVVWGATDIAAVWHVPDAIVGLTVVAIGTSLPELMTSTVAALKGEGDIAIGNALGSNIFNLLGILGIAGLIHPLTVDPQIAHYDLPFMVLTTLLLFPLVLTHKQISRREGTVMIALYVLYSIWIIVRAMS